MLKLHVVQAEEGDCLVLECGTPSSPRYVLVDGGPNKVYEDHIQHVLQGIRDAGHRLDLMVLSHVDDDHVHGLLDLTDELQQQRDSGELETIAIDALWHNTFSQTLGADVENRFRGIVTGAGSAREMMARSDGAARSIRQGDRLTRAAASLRIDINSEFTPDYLICVDDQQEPVFVGDLSLRVVGPTRKNLDALRKDWLKWLETHEPRVLARDPFVAEAAAREADGSVPNLSSIMLLAEAEGKTVLLTGDGRADHLLQGLEQAGLLGPDGSLHVDVLKVPHHGSSNNISKAFLEAVTADVYVISANGKHDNPDLAALRWIVTTAREQGRAIQIVVTNETDSTRQIVAECDPQVFGYELVMMEEGKHAMTLELAGRSPHEAVLDARREVAVQPFSGAEVSPASMPALDSLCQAYKEGQICLFTGAGVSFTGAKLYRSPGWWDLLMETYGRMNPGLGTAELGVRFAELKDRHPQAWDLASALAREAGGEQTFLPLLRRVLVGRTGRDARYKRLPRAYLDEAGTLNAAIAFCSHLRALRRHPCFVPNSNVAAVLTLNYDWFLEGGATQKYNANRFKPMASLESASDPRRLPVYHIHGYVPHGIHREPRHPLVLTAESYRNAYETTTFTTKTLDDFLGKLPALFVGVSFDDELLLRRLETLAAEPGTPTHFALVRQDSLDPTRLERLRAAGVQPILYGSHEHVPAILGHVYLTRMASEDLSVAVESGTGKRTGYEPLSGQDYWRLLLFNKP